MSIVLKQSAGALVTPTDDARLYNFLLGNQVGIVEGLEVTHLGGNQLKVSAGWGICQGRQFAVEEETINATVATTGTMNGRLLIHIDVTAETPITFATQAAVTLPELTQENINSSGTIYEIALATYTVTEIAISNVVLVSNLIATNSDKLGGQLPSYYGKATDVTTAQNTANAAMPRTGGIFTNEVTFADGIKASQKLSMKLLWENASPTSAFAEQTLNLDLSKYDNYMVVAKWAVHYGQKISPIVFNKKELSGGVLSLHDAYRIVTPVVNGINFEDTKLQNNTTANQFILPYQIYGIKGVIENV